MPFELEWSEHATDHGISRAESELVLEGRDANLLLDLGLQKGERRYAFVGPSATQGIIVVITTVRGERQRVISAYPIDRGRYYRAYQEWSKR